MRKSVTLLAIVLSTAIVCTAQGPDSRPATPPSEPSTAQRLNSLIALIEGQNSPDVRRTVTREMLLQRWPETAPRVALLLSGSNAPAKTAVASVLGEMPEFLESTYIDPLFDMLADESEQVRTAAANALAAYRDHGVTPRLRNLVADGDKPRQARLAAIRCLGQMPRRSAIEVLVEALGTDDAEFKQGALTALETSSGMDFAGDSAAALAWWRESSSLSADEWQQRQIERLVRENRAARRHLEAAQSRLAKVLEAGFLRASDAERVALLTEYLADSELDIRLLGLKLTQLHLAEGKAIPADLQARIRELLESSAPREQAAAVRTVASLRQPQDAERFIAMLSRVHSTEVRLALINGLSHVGDGQATEVLLSELDRMDETAAMEAVAALGRLAERGVLQDQARPDVVAALQRVFDSTHPGQERLRERVLWAMGNVADSSFGPAFAVALDRRESVAVRQAAVRGIDGLRDPALADALTAAVDDPDNQVRKAAIESLARLGSAASEKHLSVLWQRAVSPEENEESIRQAAVRALVEILSRGSAEDIAGWIEALATPNVEAAQRATEVLERVARLLQESDPASPARMGVIGAGLARLYARVGRMDEVVPAYAAALAALHGAKSAAVPEVMADLMRYALANGRYDAEVAGILGGTNPGPDLKALWQVVEGEVEARLNASEADQALAMLAAVEAHPPGAWPPDTLARLKALRTRAVALKKPAQPASAPASQPASAPAQAPSGTSASRPAPPVE